MNCPVCQKTLAPTISVCFSCGAMVADSVREELEIKMGPVVKIISTVKSADTDKTVSQERKEIFSMPAAPKQIQVSAPPVVASVQTAAPIHTAEINVKTTVPTLVEFQSKNSAIPDWRLKMQNAVRQRMDGQPLPTATTAVSTESAVSAPRTRLVTNGANALKAEFVEEFASIAVHRDERVANALKRIEESRQAYFVEETLEETPLSQPANSNKNFPFTIAPKTGDPIAKPLDTKASINVLPKPKLVAYTRNADGDLDTNKLPPLSSAAKIAVELPTLPKEFVEPKLDENLISGETDVAAEIAETAVENNEVDDIAPFAMRFNAGLFDLIIGAFASLILLAPFMLAGGEWFSFKGFLAFTVTCSVVMFIYMTLTTGLFGRTLGMRLFSLELIDIEENDYPTFHQAAVNSAVYLLSLFFGGIGFLTVPFNEEKRAVHDLVSGTIVVKEY